MMGPEALNAVKQVLWVSPQDKVYAVLDGASVPTLLDQLYGDPPPEFECLYPGELAPDMAEVAPYLVALERDSAFTDWVITQGWGNHWGLYAVAVAPTDLRALYFYMRTLNIVYDAKSKPMMFRYYDPRVLRTFLPTCGPDQVKQLFGPVARFVIEGDTPAVALTFTHVDGATQIGRRPIVTT
jgi:hypothetical protein